MENDNDEFDSELPPASLEWLESEFQNHVGFNVTLKTYEADYVNGRICGVRNGGVLLMDESKNRIYCDLTIIALYCIINPKTAKQVPPTKASKAAKKKKGPKAQKLPQRDSEGGSGEEAPKTRKKKK